MFFYFTYTLRLIAFWIFSALYTVFVTAFTVVTFKMFNTFLVSKIITFWGFCARLFFDLSVEVEGEEHLEGIEKNKSIFIFNHSSTADPFLVARVYPSNGRTIGKREIIYIPFFNLVWWALDFSFLDRNKGKESIRAFNQTVGRMFNENKTIMIAPEGTRAKDGSKLLPFKKGAFHAALEYKASTYPVVFKNTAINWPRTSFFPLKRHFKIKVLPAVKTDQWKLENLDAEIEKIRNSMLTEIE